MQQLLLAALVTALVFGGGVANAEYVDVGGRNLHYRCAGSGSPTVILESGLASPGDDGSWEAIFSAIQGATRICLYDRAGLGRSDPAPSPRTSMDSAADLNRLLVKAGITPPYILVGASIGGFVARLYANEYPEKVVGMVLVDSSHPDRWDRGRAVLPAEESDEPKAIKMMRLADRSPNPEGLDIVRSAAMVRTIKGLGDRPLVVISHSPTSHNYPGLSPVIEDKIERLWQELQVDLVKLSSRSRHVIAQKSGHVVQIEEPQLVIDAIHNVLTDTTAGLTPELQSLIKPVFDAYALVDAELGALPPATTDSERLIRLGHIDRAGRDAYSKIPLASLPDAQRRAAFEAVYAEIDRRDAANVAQLKKLLPSRGWFLKSQYGEEAAQVAWLVAQHAIRTNPDFMPIVLARMEPLLPSGEVDRQSYAMVYDRVAMSEGRFQRYGSQMICFDYKWSLYPTEDIGNVDSRRKTMDFKTTLAEDLAEFGKRPACPANYDKPLPK